MATLHPNLITGDAQIDGHHADFVAALDAVGSAAAGEMLAALDSFLAHCEAHFTFENAQMKESNFPPIGCHMGEHDMVTETVRAVRARVAQGNPEIARSLVPALTEWFENHVRSMDGILAQYLAQPPEHYAPAMSGLGAVPAGGLPA